MTFLKQNWFRLFLSFCTLVLVLTIIYALVIIPAQERAKKEADTKSNTLMRNICLAAADDQYDSLQKLNGTEHKESDGTISYTVPLTTRTWIEGRIKDMKDECYRQYPL